MEYRIRSTGQVLTEHEFRQAFNNVTFPAIIKIEDAELKGADKVYETMAPTVSFNQTVERNGVEYVDGRWQHAWKVIDITPEVFAQKREAAIALKWAEIKMQRDKRRFEGGVKVGDNWFLSTSTATSEYNTLIIMSAGYPDSTVLRPKWRTMNGAEVDMTPGLAKSILAAGFNHLKAIDDVSQAHKAAMESSDDPSQYDFSLGWPEQYVQ